MNVVDTRVVPEIHSLFGLLKNTPGLAPLSLCHATPEEGDRRCVTEREGPELDRLNNKKVDGFFGR